ncbi:MAG TPA: PHP domain-containing protein [Clostridiales bacterium]|nr:PHP domain-containing protein [Clostridiales bacterium]
MNKLYYDLHIHSCLSPCGDDDMTPANIVGMAVVNNLDVIAITDHNTCRNCGPAIEMAKEYGIIVIPGMELCTSEEVHILCLFSNLENAMKFSDYVYSQLIKVKNNEEIFGKQEVYNNMDEIIDHEPYLLINASNISFNQVDLLVKEYNGIMIPAHIDKNSNSVFSNLGFIPPESKFNTIEFASKEKIEEFYHQHKGLDKYNVIINSDAHYLENINKRTNYIECDSRDKEEILRKL